MTTQSPLPDFVVLVTASRRIGVPHLEPIKATLRAIAEPVDPARRLVLRHGACRGGDLMAAYLWPLVCNTLGRACELDSMPADWDAPCQADCNHRPRAEGQGCRQAGHRRNQAMVDKGADVCVGFPLPGSLGTWDCLERAHAADIHIWAEHSRAMRDWLAAREEWGTR